MDKLYVVTREDLLPGPQAVQSCHAAIQYINEHPECATKWFRESNYLAVLSVNDEMSLKRLIRKAEERGIRFSIFREPDLDNSITAVAFEPGELGKKICKGLRLALQTISVEESRTD